MAENSKEDDDYIDDQYFHRRSNELGTTKEKYMDKQRAMSFVIKALYFPKPKNEVHKAFQRMMNYEDILFRPLVCDTEK